MALPNELIINCVSGSNEVITDLGIPISSGATMTLSNYATLSEIKSSKSLYDLISSDKIRIRVGGTNLSVVESKRFFIDPIDGAIRNSVDVVSTSNVSSLSGSGSTIDGVVLAVGNRVLLTAQTTSTQNGVWIVQSGSWVRPYDFASGDSASGLLFVAKKGTSNGDAIWVCSSDTGSDVIGTNNLFFSKQVSSGTSGFPTMVSGIRFIASRGEIAYGAYSLDNITLV